MSRFSTTQTKPINQVENLAGGEAFKETSKLELISTLLTSFLDDKYYESSNETIERIRTLITNIKDKKFVAKSAIYARNVYGMRSVSHLVAGEIVKLVKNEDWTKRFIDKVVYRVDDMTEILAYYLKVYNKPIPNALKKGLALAFNKFDAYKLAKYRGENHEISLVDLINLVHPKPNEKNKEALTALVKGTLVSKDTWEKELSATGQQAETEDQKAELKADVWKKLIREKKLGYFALLRNLRNILEQAPEMIDEAIQFLTNEEAIAKSLVLPFRYLTAINQIDQISGSDAKKVIKALNKATDIACSNIPKFEGDTLVVLDVSGSMVSRCLDIGSLFASALAKTNNADVICFATHAEYVNVNTDDSVLTIANKLKQKSDELGGGTDFHSIFHTANRKYDRIIILSDMMGWIGYDTPVATFNSYKKITNSNPKVFSFNLNDYGSLQFPQPNVYCFAGWSERALDIIKLLETNKNALIAEVEKIEI